MAKKKRKSPKGNRITEENIDYRDPKQIEKIARANYETTIRNIEVVRKTNPNYAQHSDLDPYRAKRRIKAIAESAAKIRPLIQDVCPDAEFFKFEEDWAYINFLPSYSYEELERIGYLSLGASIWILDHIKAAGRIDEVSHILADIWDLVYEDDLELPFLYDTVHQESLIHLTAFAIRYRNSDCDIPGLPQAEKTELTSRPHGLADIPSALRKQHQNVPSRKRFEKLIALLPEDAIQEAITEFEKKFTEWIVCFFRCRAIQCEEQTQLFNQQSKQLNLLDKRVVAINEMIKNNTLKQPAAKAPNSLPVLPQPIGTLMPNNTMERILNNPYELMEYVKSEEERMKKETDDLVIKMVKFMELVPAYSGLTPERLEERFGKEIADILLSYAPGDPYTMCFAFLYLLDNDNDLPWLYHPSTTLMAQTVLRLPWYGRTYDETLDDHWLQYYDPESYSPPPKTVPSDVGDWYRLEYRRDDDCKNSPASNLSQILYEITGAIMPRDMHRYDDVRSELIAYGIKGKKLQNQLLQCILLLGEGFAQTVDRSGTYFTQNLPMEFPEADDDDIMERIEDMQEVDEAQDIADLIAQIEALKEENKSLRKIAYTATRETKEIEKKKEELILNSNREHRELSELREILFCKDNNLEADMEEGAEGIAIPYTVSRSTVVFGGHDSWLKAIKPMLGGNIRFIDRNMNPDANLIRHAETIWIQPNSLSHSFYYTIMNTVRAQKKSVHYFKFASAEKCARQLAAKD